MSRKHLSRVLALVLALAMLFALSIPAFACSSINLTSKEGDTYWFRTCDMNDIFNVFGENGSMISSSYLVSYPAGVPINFVTGTVTPKYTVMGMSFSDSLALLDGMNDAGLVGALQNFNEGTSWPEDEVPEGCHLVAGMEVITWFLAQCKNVDEVLELVKNVRVKALYVDGIPGSDLTATMHLVFTDASGKSVVLENDDPENPGVYSVYETVGVMTNSPEYPHHVEDLANYVGALGMDSITLGGQEIKATKSNVSATLPGSDNSNDRFVRLAMWRYYCNEGRDFSNDTMLAKGFGILARVQTPLNTITPQSMYTMYSIGYDLSNQTLYIRPYDTLTYTSLSMSDVPSNVRTTYNVNRANSNFCVKAVPNASSDKALSNTQNVLVDGKSVEFQTYALMDSYGNLTNYVKLRDVASVLNGTAAQFEVGYADGTITVETGKAYTVTGTEMQTPFSGDRAYQANNGTVKVDGKDADLAAFQLVDDNGGAYTYFKLRDLGTALGFGVDFVNGQVTITTK